MERVAASTGGAANETVSGSREHARLPLTLCGALAVILLPSVIFAPAGTFSWMLEVVPGLVFVVWAALIYKDFPLSHFVYVAMFLHLLILNYGGIYTYAETPLGNWAKEAFDMSRNHYDRVGHLALGVFPVMAVREVLLRKTPLQRGGWLYFLCNCVILAIAAFWELLEWWVALIVASDTGTAFLGSQGDVWDAQWDMLLALVGSMITYVALAQVHDRSMSAMRRRCARNPLRSGD